MIIYFSFKSYMSTNHYFNLIRDIVKYLKKYWLFTKKNTQIYL